MTVLCEGDEHQRVNCRADRGVDNGARMILPLCAALLGLITAQE